MSYHTSYVARLTVRLACWLLTANMSCCVAAEQKHYFGKATFEQTLAAIEATTDQAERSQQVADLMEQVKSAGAPLVLDANHAAFIYQGEAKEVKLLGDTTNWADQQLLRRLPNTDFHFAIVELPAEARIEYLLIADGMPIKDPLTPFRVPNGIGGASEFAMPGYQHHPLFNDEVRRGKLGGYDRVERLTLPSEKLGYEKEVHVYTPKDCDPSAQLPTLYVHDGRDYIEFAHMPALLDYLVDRGMIQPINAVFVSPPNRHQPAMPNRVTEYGLNPDYVAFMADELVPLIDQRYPTLAKREARMTLGDSYAGLVSAYIAHARSDTFGLACSQSGYVSCNADKLIKAYAQRPSEPIRLYVDSGIYERSVGKGWLPEEEYDFLEANRRFKKVLEENEYDFVYREYPEGHTWGNWRRHAADALIHFFGQQE